MQNKVLGCLGIGVAVALVISLMANVFLFLGVLGSSMDPIAAAPPSFQEQLEAKGDPGVDQKIVHIDLEGLITGMSGSAFGGSMVETTKRALAQAKADGKVAGVVLRINSPGGEVTASDTLYHAVQELAAKKPVIVFMDSIAASGGYYIACGATKIMAAETTITGSIGVMMAAPNYKDLMDKIGLDMMVFKSGAFKDTLRGSREMRDDERAYIQSQVDEMYAKFVGIVADARALPLEDLRGGLADGRIFSGAAAAENGLIDGTGYLEDAYELARQEAGVPGAKVVRYRMVPSLAGILRMLGEAPAGGAATTTKLELDLGIGGLMADLEPGCAYLLPGYLLP
ncbi:signal peptide peptidase SppA [soil metagenome]